MADAILNPREVQEIERAAFGDGIDAETLMDQAGEGIANAILEEEPRPGICVAYLGKGNNAGDAIVAGSLLASAGWQIWLRPLTSESDLQGLPKKKLQQLNAYRAPGPLADLPKNKPRVILDGLLGLGSRAGLNAPLKSLTRELNALRLASNAPVYAVDLPTGLGEEGIDSDAVVADFTLTIGFAKAPLFRDEASFRRLYEERLPYYQQADYRIESSGESIRVVEQILALGIFDRSARVPADGIAPGQTLL